MAEVTVSELAKSVGASEDLAEQAIDNLLDVQGIDEARAGELILTARAPWFEASEAESEA